MVKIYPEGQSLEKIISAGLGKSFALRCPYFSWEPFLSGMPIAAFIVGQYFSAMLGGQHIIQYMVGLVIIFTGAMINLFGIKTGKKFK